MPVRKACCRCKPSYRKVCTFQEQNNACSKNRLFKIKGDQEEEAKLNFSSLFCLNFSLMLTVASINMADISS